ncbi:hypothetical protein TUM4644_30310 [Shewanella colwelliana]|uniref:Uncharacterized protein n=1 Tax=Shewanella colwelliana TaxID=23 RepID=A0A1E5ISL4_SHECO|nr:hypothetical protein [Shewanella colwelliana]MDX1281978.1 hypothetical protein [Shewanella colwelliana]OEG73550.1 hypothetical protein BEL05_18405 [Shewanella colwelliana]GIU30962.1 hypothetical protein TUM4644_30310 [Shewanella colwelliana]GIU40420.1 hypothetical protein TUM3794_18290 [Shewanella colwelliana]
MINFKTVFAIALLSASTAATADEIVIDTTDLHASISAQLAEGLVQMQQDLNEDLNAVLVAQEDEATKVTVQRAE